MVFRTDEIVTKPIEVKASDMVRPKVPKERNGNVYQRMANG